MIYLWEFVEYFIGIYKRFFSRISIGKWKSFLVLQDEFYQVPGASILWGNDGICSENRNERWEILIGKKRKEEKIKKKRLWREARDKKRRRRLWWKVKRKNNEKTIAKNK